MSKSLGPLTFGKRREQIFLGREIAQHRHHSEATAVEIDREVRKIVMGCYDRAHQILEEQADALTRVAEALLEHEVLDAEQIAALVKGEPLPMRPERSTDSREQLEAAREETGDSTKQATRAGDGLRMLPQPGRQPAR
jgi:cell division protease FtsH